MKSKFNNEETVTLIKLKHSQEYINMFEKSENRPKALKEAWIHLSNAVNKDYDYLDVKAKYNQLLSKYKYESAESNRSGAASSSWKYWNIFNSSFPKKIF